jgi:ankyrin repeat protein
MAAALDSPWEQYLRPVIASVVEVLQPTLVIDNLFAKKVINRVDYEDIVGNRGIALSEPDKARLLLSRLMSKGHNEFKVFLQILQQTEGQSHVADIIEEEMTKSASLQATPVDGATTIPQASEIEQSDPPSVPREERRTENLLSAAEMPSETVQSLPSEPSRVEDVAPPARQAHKRIVFFVKKSHRPKFRLRRTKLYTMCCRMFDIKKEDFKVYYEDPDETGDSETEENDTDSDNGLHAFVSHDDKVVCLVLHGISKAQFTDEIGELIDTIATFLHISSDDVEVESMKEKSVMVFLRLPIEAVLDLLCAFADPQSLNQLQTAVQTAVPLASKAKLKVGSLPSMTLFNKDLSATHPLGQAAGVGLSNVNETLMFNACQTGDYELVEDLYELGVSLTVFNANGQQPIHVASYTNHVKVVEMLLSKGIPVDSRDRNGETPLHYAAIYDSIEVGKILVKNGHNIETPNIKGETPLHKTPTHNSLNIASLLLDKKAYVNCTDQNSRTPLHFTAQYNSTDVAQLLLQHNCEVNARDKDDWTPLHITAQYNSTDVAQLLLQYICEVDARTNKQYSTDVAQLLLQHITPLHITAQYNLLLM